MLDRITFAEHEKSCNGDISVIFSKLQIKICSY